MPFSDLANQVQTTVSDKLSSIAQTGLGTVSGLAGSLSSGASAAASAFGAFAGRAKSLLSAGNLSPAALAGTAAQQVKALAPSSIYAGLPKPAAANPPREIRPEMAMIRKQTGSLKFPSDLGDHFIQFHFSEMAQKSPLDLVKRLDSAFIQLPLSPSLTESYQANYKTENLGVMGGVADTILQDFLSKPGVKNMGAEQQGQELGKSFNDFLGSEKAKAAAAAVGAQVVASSVPGLAGAVSKALGATINPNQAVLFDNVSFRSHSFSFKLFPVNIQESNEIKKIIALFRERMLPPTINQFFLGFPNKVEIKIYPKAPYPILDCVLESMSVNYAPNGPAFFKGSQGNPVQVDLQLTFKEIVLFNREVAIQAADRLAKEKPDFVGLP